MMEEIRSIYCINFIGAVTIPGKYSIITEFCEHGSLASVLKKFSLCYCMKVKMACDAAKGMHYLHTNGIIHRDFKPDNLLVCSLLIDSPVSCKLTDFGTTREINENSTTQKYTMGVGTLMYLAPELLSPDKADAHYDKSCDVFAYGVTLFELFVEGDCYPPEQFRSVINVAQFILAGKRRPPPIDCPEEYATLIDSCWKQQSEDRKSFADIDVQTSQMYEKERRIFDPSSTPVTTPKQHPKTKSATS